MKKASFAPKWNVCNERRTGILKCKAVKKRMSFAFFAAAMLFGVSSGVSAFEITKDTAVVLPEKPLKSSVLAAEELKKYVEKVSGIRLAGEKGKAKNFIHIGLASDFPFLPSSLKEKLKKAKAGDSYIFHAEGNNMYFAGKSKTGELYAVYQFLDRELGIRFFKPANKEDDGEYVPFEKRSVLKIKDSSFVREPAFRRRELAQTGWNWSDHPVNGIVWIPKGGYQIRAAYFHKVRINSKNAKQVELYDPRTTNIWEDNHHSLFWNAIPAKKYFKTHPEYFALVNGKRTCTDISTTAYCLSNPDVRKLVADYIIQDIKKKKAMGLVLQQGAGMADMSRGWCECENCLKENGSKTFSWQNISNVYNRTFKAIFDLVYKECPDADLMIWAYHTYRTPPTADVKHDDRVHFEYMTHGRCYAHAFDEPCSRNQKLLKWMKEYIPRFKRSSVYEYFLCSGGRNYVPHELTQVHDLRLFHKEGITGWEEEVFFEDSVYWRKNVDSTDYRETLPSLWQWLYLTGKMLWDPGQDPVKILEDAESKYYGNAYPAMKKYHALRRKLWKEGKNCFGYPFFNERLPLLLNVPETKEKLFALLDEAEKLAKGDKKRLVRIANDRKFLKKYWVKAHEEYKRLQGKTVKAPTVKTPIVIDGKGDDAAWKDAFYVTDFRETYTEKHNPIPAEVAVSIGILSDSRNLYFLVKGKEPLMGKLYKGKTFWEKSSVEIFIHPQSAANEYYHLAFALDGEKYEARCPGNARHDIGAEWKSSKSADGYCMEIKVPAWKFGEFRNGVTWKCSFGVNRFVYTDHLVKGLYTLGGSLSHAVTKFLPLQIGTPMTINGMFNKLMKNKHKYPDFLKVLDPEKVPAGWYASLPKKEGAVFGIKRDAAPYDETLYITNVFANHTLPSSLKAGEKVIISFEAKGKGTLDCGIIRHQKKPHKFIRTEYPSKGFVLADEWRKFSLEYVMKENEYISIGFNAFRCEAQIDNVTLVVKELPK